MATPRGAIRVKQRDRDRFVESAASPDCNRGCIWSFVFKGPIRGRFVLVEIGRRPGGGIHFPQYPVGVRDVATPI